MATPTDPLTREYEQGQESILELEQRAVAQRADRKAMVDQEINVADLEARIANDEFNPVPDVPAEDDGFWNNSWEVGGSAIERAAEQVVRTLGDVTSFAEDVGGKLVVADPEHLVNPDDGIPLPFTNARFDWMSKDDWESQAFAYEVATGKSPTGISDFELPDVDRPDSGLGQMSSGFLQWGIVFAATRKAGLGNIAGSVVADFTAFDPHEARLADLAATLGEGNPVFDNAFTQFMSADPSDTAIEGRLKNAVEGLLIGGAIETSMAGFRWLRGYRAAKQAAGARELKDIDTLTPQGPDVPVREVDDNITTARLPDDAGNIQTVSRGDNLQVIHSEVADKLQGTGLGKQLYDDAIDQAETAGRRLVSDTEVSESAARVWESMARRGDDIVDQRVTNPDNVIREVNAGDGSVTFKTKNGTPLFERVKGATDDIDLDTAARETLEGGKAGADTLHDVALRQLKNTLKADPAKLRAVRAALEDGNYHEAQELLDFNGSTVDWDGLTEQVGKGGADEIRNVINKFSEVFEAEMKSAKGYQSGAETLARSVGATADDVLKLGRDVKGGQGLAARMAGADTVLYQSTQRLRQLAKVAATGNEADVFALFKQIDLHASLQATIKGSRSEIARALEQMKRISTQNVDEFTEFDALMRDSTGLNGDQRRHLAQKIADLKDMNAINQLTRKTRWQRARDMWVEVYINGLLSAVSTVMLNNASNMLKLVEGITERYIAAAVGGVKNVGRRAVGRESAERITFKEANAYLYGTMHGLDAAMRIPFKGIFDAIKADGLKGVKQLDPESFGSVYRAFGGEKPVLDTRMRVDADTRKAIHMADESDISIAESLRTMNLKAVNWDAKAVNAIGKLVRIPGRLIVTSDEFFKQVVYHQHLASQAYKHGDAMATSLNKKGKAKACTDRAHAPQLPGVPS
jgi:predicted GNAT family acetyltransferase